MMKSMTGYGRGEGETTVGRVFVESRSVNHRYCEISIKVPKRLVPFEARMKELIRSEVSRGKIDVVLRLDQSGEGKVQFQDIYPRFSKKAPLARLYELAHQMAHPVFGKTSRPRHPGDLIEDCGWTQMGVQTASRGSY